MLWMASGSLAGIFQSVRSASGSWYTWYRGAVLQSLAQRWCGPFAVIVASARCGGPCMAEDAFDGHSFVVRKPNCDATGCPTEQKRRRPSSGPPGQLYPGPLRPGIQRQRGRLVRRNRKDDDVVINRQLRSASRHQRNQWGILRHSARTHSGSDPARSNDSHRACSCCRPIRHPCREHQVRTRRRRSLGRLNDDRAGYSRITNPAHRL